MSINSSSVILLLAIILTSCSEKPSNIEVSGSKASLCEDSDVSSLVIKTVNQELFGPTSNEETANLKHMLKPELQSIFEEGMVGNVTHCNANIVYQTDKPVVGDVVYTAQKNGKGEIQTRTSSKFTFASNSHLGTQQDFTLAEVYKGSYPELYIGKFVVAQRQMKMKNIEVVTRCYIDERMLVSSHSLVISPRAELLKHDYDGEDNRKIRVKKSAGTMLEVIESWPREKGEMLNQLTGHINIDGNEPEITNVNLFQNGEDFRCSMEASWQ